MVLKIFKMGKYSKSRAKQWNRSRGFGKWCLKMFSCSYYLSAYGTLGMRLLKWPVDGIVTVSKKFRFGVLFIVSLCYLIARVTVCCLLSVWCFSSAQFFFLLPFVINCNVLRATKKYLSIPYWGSLQWLSGAGWDLPHRSFQPEGLCWNTCSIHLQSKGPMCSGANIPSS